MNRQPNATLNHTPSPLLSVSYKSPELLDELLNNLPDPVLITDANFMITGINHTAEAIFGFRSDETIGKLLFSLFEFEVIDSTWGEAIKELYTNSFWTGELAYKHNDFRRLYFRTTCTLIDHDKKNSGSVVFVCHNITDNILQQKDFDQFQNKYQTVVESLSDGVILMNANGLIETANKRAIEILGLTKEQAEGREVANPSWSAVKEDGSVFPVEEFPAVHTLRTGEAQNNVVMGLTNPDGKKIWISINTRAITREGKESPDAVVASFEDITLVKEAKEKLVQSEQLFRSFMSNSPNLGWVYDEDGTFIYGNPFFLERVGLSEDAFGKNIVDLSSQKMTETILQKNKIVLETGETLITEDQLPGEDGSVSYFLAYWFLLPFSNGKKMIGGHAIDITDRKKMRDELMKSQVLKQKQINIATLKAQEEERNRLSEELHDNVNQLLISSKLHIGAAKTADNRDELMNKAADYIMMAIEEIRKLSRELNSKIVSNVGIQKSIGDIVINLKQLTGIEVETDIHTSVIDKLTDEQQLMVFRVVQEQSNNIIKYAQATKVHIALNEESGYFKLLITDNGKGFNVEEVTKKEQSGIGFTNMNSRVDACNGTFNIQSSPGNGCTLQIIFPAHV